MDPKKINEIFDLMFQVISAQVLASSTFLSLPVIRQVFLAALRAFLRHRFDEAVAVVSGLQANAVEAHYEEYRDKVRAELSKPKESQDAQVISDFRDRLRDLIHFYA